jgi:ferric-dicitrate binding protein FerR (iron transport regulator)
MKLEVTREVVSDLWPLYQSGEASTNTRALVEAYLAGDETFASTLRESERVTAGIHAPRLSPDAELRLLEAAQQRARMKLWIIAGSIGLGGLMLLIALVAVIVLFRGGV